MKKLVLALFMVLCFCSCTVITYDYTVPRHRVYVEPSVQIIYTPYWTWGWYNPWAWYGMYCWHYPQYYGSIYSPSYVIRDGVKRTVTKRELTAPGNTTQKTVRRPVRSTESKGTVTKTTARKPVRATTGARTGKTVQTSGKRVKKK